MNGEPLSPRYDLWNYSPTGFEWGYASPGAAQLALAILADHLRDNELAIDLHQRFKWSIVTQLSREGWTLTDVEVAKAVQELIQQTHPTQT